MSGSNSVRLVVFDGAARVPAYFYNEKIMCRSGRRTWPTTGRLNPAGASGRFAALAASRLWRKAWIPSR